MSLFERKKWVGDKQIDSAEPMPDQLDSAGNPLVKVKYIQGGVEYFTGKMLEAVISDKSLDATGLRDKRCHVMAAEILKVLSEYGLKTAEFEHLFAVLKLTMNQRINQATDFLWGVDDQNVSVIDLARVLKDRDTALGLNGQNAGQSKGN